MRSAIYGSVATTCFLAAAGVASAQSATIVGVRAGWHIGLGPSPTPQATWDAQFSLGNQALTQSSSGTDLACNLLIVRAGDLWQVSVPGTDADMSNGMEYASTVLNAQDVYMIEVNSIAWCGSNLSTPAGGCGWIEGNFNPVTVTRFTLVNGAGAVLTHEYGHSVGNTHRWNMPDDNTVMSPFALINGVHDEVNATECGRFKTDRAPWPCPSGDHWTWVACSAAPSGFAAMTGADAVESASGVNARPFLEPERKEDNFANVPLSDLLKQRLDYVPAEVEQYYGAEDVAVLWQQLQSAKTADDASMAVGLIGLISNGNDQDVTRLIEFVEAARAEPSRHLDLLFGARALGVIGARTTNKRGVDYLLELFSSDADRRVHEYVGTALGMSGDSRALTVLENDKTEYMPGIKQFALEIEENRSVAKLGFRGHARRPAMRTIPPVLQHVLVNGSRALSR